MSIKAGDLVMIVTEMPCGYGAIGEIFRVKRISDAWPKCAVSVCQNKCCLRLNSIYCWPHTPGTVAEAKENLVETEREEQTA